MKRMLLTVSCLFLGVTLTQAAGKTWTGKISDSMCGASHKGMVSSHQKSGEMKQTEGKDADRECTLACIKEGAKYVFVSQGKVFEISNQNLPALEEHAGHMVKLTGDLAADGKTIEVSNITMLAKAEKSTKSDKGQY